MKYPNEKCDENCYYYCTKGGAHPPDCLTENKVNMKALKEIKDEYAKGCGREDWSEEFEIEVYEDIVKIQNIQRDLKDLTRKYR